MAQQNSCDETVRVQGYAVNELSENPRDWIMAAQTIVQVKALKQAEFAGILRIHNQASEMNRLISRYGKFFDLRVRQCPPLCRAAKIKSRNDCVLQHKRIFEFLNIP